MILRPIAFYESNKPSSQNKMALCFRSNKNNRFKLIILRKAGLAGTVMKTGSV